jgi:hypothetical protein
MGLTVTCDGCGSRADVDEVDDSGWLVLGPDDRPLADCIIYCTLCRAERESASSDGV